MRLTTSAAAVAAVAGFALIAGCSSSAPSGFPARRPAPAKAAASTQEPVKQLTPRQQLAKAYRNTLAAHTASFRQRLALHYVESSAPEEALRRNPLETTAGTVNFDRNWMTYHIAANPAGRAASTAQPRYPDVNIVRKKHQVYVGVTSLLSSVFPGVPAGAWLKGSVSGQSSTADQFVDVLANRKGKVHLVKKEAVLRDGDRGLTKYALRVDIGRMLTDGGEETLGQQLRGQTAREVVWVDGQNRIVQVRTIVDAGRVQLPGVDPSLVRSIVTTVRLTNYGVDMVVPSHPTKAKDVPGYQAAGTEATG